MRTLGGGIMIAAVLALLAVAVAARARYLLNHRPLREPRPVEWLDQPSPPLRFLGRPLTWTVFLTLFLLLGVGWVLHHFG